MECNNITQNANRFKGYFTIKYPYQTEWSFSELSKAYSISGLATIQFKIDVEDGKKENSRRKQKFLLKFEKCFEFDALIMIEIKIKSGRYDVATKCLYCDPRGTDSWRSLLSVEDYLNTFAIDISMTRVAQEPRNKSLYDDKELMDFQLNCEDGSVSIHRFVLAACSPVLRTMLAGEWKENKDGRLELPELSKSTLNQLKDYLYLDKLPSILPELEHLLILACKYMMTELIQACSINILLYITSENVMHYMQLAFFYKLKTLFKGILYIIQGNGGGAIDLSVVESKFEDDWV